jgi:hypothetical protein
MGKVHYAEIFLFPAEKVAIPTASSGFFAENILRCGVNLNLGSGWHGWIIQD